MLLNFYKSREKSQVNSIFRKSYLFIFEDYKNRISKFKFKLFCNTGIYFKAPIVLI